MKRVATICWNDCRLIVRDKNFLIFSLLLPLIFAFFFTKAFSGAGQTPRVKLLVVNHDRGSWGGNLLQKINQPDLDVQVVAKEPAEFSRLLIIPADFSDRIASRTAQALQLKTDASTRIESVTQVEISIIQAIARLLAEIVLNPDPAADAAARRRPFQELIILKSGLPAGTLGRIPSGFDHQVPGTLVNFVLMMALIAGAITILIDRRSGMLARILSSSVSVPELWLGKFLGRLLVAVIQSFILLAAGKIFFGFHLGSFWLTSLIIIGFSMAVTSLSLLLGSLVRREELVIAIAVLLANIMAALGGCWWPIEIVSRPFRLAGMLFPTYWAMDGFHRIIFFNQGLSQVLPNLLILVAYALLFSLLSFKFFKIDR